MVIRSLGGGTGDSAVLADPELVGALLAFDEPVALLKDRPVDAGELWRRALRPLLADADAATLVHPSWWSLTRVAAVVDAARTQVARVEPVSRARLLARRFPDSLMVEVAPDLVVVTAAGSEVLGAELRWTPADVVADAVTALVRRHVGARSICVDTPAEVPGAPALAGLVADRLRGAGLQVRRVDHRQFAVFAEDSHREPAPEPEHRPRFRRRAVAVTAVPVAAVALAAWWGQSGSAVPHAETATTALVEGRMTVQVPVDWTVRRVTAGPGSVRVEAVSPQQSALLHLTQARVPSSELSATAVALRVALDAQPPGVFVDFNPSDSRAGRPAVTYREVRSGHDIRWTVVVDGGIRIGVGCQSAAGREGDIDAVCETAVRTARRIG
jgi:type VII secretion-associated protein (TIGR03931 family)